MGQPAADGPPQHLPSAAPARPIPARLDAALATLELTVRRRLDGLLQGNHLGLVPGPGTEPGDARPYNPGDDVRRMDWSVTARTTEPHIRQTVADRELETWLVADLSASLDFGTTGCEKRDLVVAAAAAVGHLTRGGGNRIGAVVATGGGMTRVPARGGRPHLQHLLRVLAATPRSGPGDRGDLAVALEQLRRPPRRRGLAVVISDFIGPARAGNARCARCPAGTTCWPSRCSTRGTSNCRPSAWSPCWIRRPAAPRRSPPPSSCGRRSRRPPPSIATEVAVALRRAGAAHLVLRTDRDWVADVMRFVMSRKRGWTGAAAGAPGSPNAARAGEAW